MKGIMCLFSHWICEVLQISAFLSYLTSVRVNYTSKDNVAMGSAFAEKNSCSAHQKL